MMDTRDPVENFMSEMDDKWIASKGLRVRPSATTTQPTHARRVAFMKSSAAFLACGLAAAYNMAELPRCAK